MKHITKETILIQGEKKFRPVEIHDTIMWEDTEQTKELRDNEPSEVMNPIKGVFIAQSKPQIQDMPTINLQANNTMLIMEGENPIDLNAYTEKDVRKALSMAFNQMYEGGNITSDEIIAEINKVESIEVDDNFEIITFN